MAVIPRPQLPGPLAAPRCWPNRQPLGTHLRQPPGRDHHRGRPASLLRLRVPVPPARGCGPDHDRWRGKHAAV